MPDPQIDIVKAIFDHRLQQEDMDDILAALSTADRGSLVSKMGELLRRISALVEVSTRVSDSLSLDTLLPRLIGIITEALNADRSTLFLNDEDTGELFSKVLEGESINEIRFPNNLGIAGSVFHSGKHVIINDPYNDSRFNSDFDKKTGYRTKNILCSCISNKGKNLGVIQVINKEVNGEGFDSNDLSLLEALTSQASSALNNAMLYERIERSNREEVQLREVANAIASELDLSVLLTKIMAAITMILDAERSTLFLYDKPTETLYSNIAEGLEMKEIRIPKAAGLAGTCFVNVETINIPDAYADTRFNQTVDKKTGFRTRNMLCMPIINKNGNAIGVIQVLNKKGSPFSRADENKLKSFCAQAVIALENAQLFEDVNNERKYNDSILESLSNGVITLDENTKIVKANHAVLRMLDVAAEKLIGSKLGEYFINEESRWIISSLDKVMSSGESDTSVDTEIRLRNKETLSINLNIVPLLSFSEKATGYMLILEDITSEKRVKSTMARYMTKEIADRLLEGGESALGGKAQQGTVLFSDIRKFTTISESLGARDTVGMLNEYFTRMVDVIFEHDGILDKYIGDAIMATFGIPFPSAEDANHAVAVANQMITVLRVFNEERKSNNLMPIRIGIGVSSGELVAGNIGSPKRMEYTVIGDTVNTAARLEGATKFYGVEILISEFTMKELRSDFRLREIDLIQVKGKMKPVAIYECLSHHTEVTFPHMDKTLEAFTQGLALFRQLKFKEALGCFHKALDFNPQDNPSKLYIDRCELYIKTPPDENWNGVCVMTVK